jgi:hypothetical protein
MKTLNIIRIALVLGLVLVGLVSQAYGQITFTESELLQLAEQNLERKQCLELRSLDKMEIDSLSHKCTLLSDQIAIQDSMINNYSLIVNNFKRIEGVQQEQIRILKEDLEENKKIIKKQNRKLTFWRIFTPSAVTGIAVLSILIK